MDTIKQMLKSKTMIFAIALAGLGALQASSTALAPFMSPLVYGIFTLVVAVAVAILRVLTTTSISEK